MHLRIPEHAVHGFRTKATTDSGLQEKLDAMWRNRWSAWPRMGGRHPSESMVSMARIMHEEELGRMSDIVDHLAPHSLMLFNEAFAATNEREGSEIARQITCALMERHVKVFFVTHLYEFAHGLYEQNLERAIFLRAERKTDGSRTYRVVEGRPLKTSFGMDLYRKIFDTEHAVDDHGA